jgi:hypothetical protein
MPNPNAATINLAFTSFVANSNLAPASGAPLGSFCVTSTLAFGTAGSGDTSDANGQVTISGTTIKVKRNTNGNGNQPIKIQLNVSCANDTINYNPQGIYFDQQTGSGDGNGNNNFPQANQNPNDQSITISDNMTNPVTPGTSFSWNFYIQIKQMNTGTPTPAQPLGWIDPIIENDA